jgi:hypothetical protein
MLLGCSHGQDAMPRRDLEGRPDPDGTGDEWLRYPLAILDAYRRAAAALDAWYDDPCAR